jgi:predicted RNase H-like nuclease (RuvC/YqgF family)
MKIKRYKVEYDSISHTIFGVECDNGRFVEYKDYEHLSDYCDRLVEVGKLPCLPKDLENLRNANTQFAIENEDLKQKNQALKIAIQDYSNELEGMEKKWECAIDMAAQAELAKEEALKLRDKWHAKWMNSRHECHDKIDALVARLDEIGNNA